MYNYILGKWVRKEITEVQVYTLVPFYLTQEQADSIVATPQNA
jgi:hypothetical protein